MSSIHTQTMSKERRKQTRSTTDQSSRFFVGQRVLAQWVDGLYYLGSIYQVAANECIVSFEDKSRYTIMHKHITLDAKAEISCCMCLNDESILPNEIVLCDNCPRGYHQSCHSPCIDKLVLKPGVRWTCRLCVFSSTVKNGGVKKSNKAFQTMKMILPYKLSSLTWNQHHTSNTQNTYCYCGGPGQWFQKMLQCCRCEQWFHEACCECIEQPIHYADRFHIFVCALCNEGTEFLTRLPMTWVDIVQIAMFNLNVLTKRMIQDLEEHIMPWIVKHRESFLIDKYEELPSSRNGLRKLLNDLMRSAKAVFVNGTDMHIKVKLFRLRDTRIPQVASFTIPAYGPITLERLQTDKNGEQHLFCPSHSNEPVDVNKIYSPKHTFINGQLQVSSPRHRPRAKVRHNGQTVKRNKLRTNGQIIKLVDDAISSQISPGSHPTTKRKRTPDSSTTSTPTIPPAITDKTLSPPPKRAKKLLEPQNLKTLAEKIPEKNLFRALNNPFYTKFELKELKRRRQIKRKLKEQRKSGLPIIDSPEPSSNTSLIESSSACHGDGKIDLNNWLASVKSHGTTDSNLCDTDNRKENSLKFNGLLKETSLENLNSVKVESTGILSPNNSAGILDISDVHMNTKINPDSRITNPTDTETIIIKFPHNAKKLRPKKKHESDFPILTSILSQNVPPVLTPRDSPPPPLIDPPSPPLSTISHENPPKLEKEVTRRSSRKRRHDNSIETDEKECPPLKVSRRDDADITVTPPDARFNGQAEFMNFLFTRPNSLPVVDKNAVVKPLKIETDFSPDVSQQSSLLNSDVTDSQPLIDVRSIISVNIKTDDRAPSPCLSGSTVTLSDEDISVKIQKRKAYIKPSQYSSFHGHRELCSNSNGVFKTQETLPQEYKPDFHASELVTTHSHSKIVPPSLSTPKPLSQLNSVTSNSQDTVTRHSHLSKPHLKDHIHANTSIVKAAHSNHKIFGIRITASGTQFLLHDNYKII